MGLIKPFNLQQWVDQHRHELKPPVGNKKVFTDNDDFIVMVIGGPNHRKDFHYEEGEELFYQIEGNINVRVVEDGEIKDIPIKEGEMFLLPPQVPHSPQREEGSIGMVVERYRKKGEQDGFMWFCENCNNKLYEEYFVLTDIVSQLPKVMENFYSDEQKRTCDNCGTVMERPD